MSKLSITNYEQQLLKEVKEDLTDKESKVFEEGPPGSSVRE